MTRVILFVTAVATAAAADQAGVGVNYFHGSDARQWHRTSEAAAGASALTYSTFLGGGGNDHAAAVTTDPDGNIYVVGNTSSPDFPTNASAFVSQYAGGQADAFAAKFNSRGDLIYCTFLGGNLFDAAIAVAADRYGNAYITGRTQSSNFPTSTGAFMESSAYAPYRGLSSIFVTKLNAAGNAIVYSTLLGSGTSADTPAGIAVDFEGNAYVIGYDRSPEVFTTAGALGDQGVNLLAKLNPAGTRIIYATRMPYAGDVPTAIAVDSAGNAYLTGFTVETVTRPNAIQPNSGSRSIFKTIDGGAHWTVPGSPVGTMQVRTVAVDPKNGSIIYAGGNPGLFKSTDGGETWTSIFSDKGATSILIDPADSAHLILLATGTFGNTSAEYVSRNGGFTWASKGEQLFQTIVFDPLRPQNVYGSSAVQNFSYSRDGGETWTAVATNSQLNAFSWGRPAIDPSNPDTIYSVTNVGILKSTNAGVLWTRLSQPFLSQLIAINPLNTRIIYSSSSSALYKSTDGGVSFTLGPLAPSIINGLVFDPIDRTKLYVLTSTGILQSTDGGATMTALPGQPLNPATFSLAFDLQHAGTFFENGTLVADAFVTKVNADGTATLFSTYLGGSGADSATAIALDPSGNVYIGGTTSSADLPGATSVYAGISDGFVAKLTGDGALLSYSAFAGGSGSETATAIAVDSSGMVAIAGSTRSTNFPATPDAIQPMIPAFSSGYFTVFDTNGVARSASYLGGSQGDSVSAIAFDPPGRLCIVGDTNSADFKTSPNAVQPVRNGFTDAFLAIVSVKP